PTTAAIMVRARTRLSSLATLRPFARPGRGWPAPLPLLMVHGRSLLKERSGTLRTVGKGRVFPEGAGLTRRAVCSPRFPIDALGPWGKDNSGPSGPRHRRLAGTNAAPSNWAGARWVRLRSVPANRISA